MTDTRQLQVPGATICYEVRGSGPVLVIVGSPMDAGPFSPLAELLADEYTVVTHDPRGAARSTVDDPSQDATPQLRANDVLAVLDAIGADTADLLGSSGGAVTGLALAARSPRRLRTLVAHEPPLLTLLDDAASRLAATDRNITIFHEQGLGAAWAQFMEDAGFDLDRGDAPEPQAEPTQQDLADGARFFAHTLMPTVAYEPDIEPLRSGPTRIEIGIGADSRDLVTHSTSTALAKRLEVEPVGFPGGHAGFIEEPAAFATVLRSVLAGH